MHWSLENGTLPSISREFEVSNVWNKVVLLLVDYWDDPCIFERRFDNLHEESEE